MPIEPASTPPETPDAIVLRALAELNLQPDPAAAQARVCLALRELFGADRAWLFGRSLAYDPSVPALAAPDRFTYAESLAAGASTLGAAAKETLLAALGVQAAEGPGPALLARTGSATGAAAEALDALGARSILVRPLRVRGSLWGHLAAAVDEDGFAPSDAALAALETLASSVEGLLGHMEDEARLGLSRMLAEQLIEQIPVAVFVIDDRHRIAMLNGHTARIAGMDARDVLREGCVGLFCDGKTDFGACPGFASFRTGANWDGEVELKGRHYRVAVRPIRDGDRIPYSLVMLDDCTENLHNRRLLEASVLRLERLLRQSDRIRAFLTRLATNQDPSEVLNQGILEAAELLDASCAYLLRIWPDGREEAVFRWFRDPATGEAFAREFSAGTLSSLVRGRGEVIHIRGRGDDERDRRLDELLGVIGCNRILVEPLLHNGVVWGRMGFATEASGDVSRDDRDLLHEAAALAEIAIRRNRLLEENRRKEEGLREAAEKAQAAARAKTTFLATMSHEIRTPLNAVVGFSETLARLSGLPAEARECTEGISQSANALLDLINDILDFAKLESGTDIGMLRGECDLGALFREMKTVFRYSARARGIELRCSIPAGFPRLHLSPTRFRQILLNLVGNAVKFTPKGFVEWTASCEPAGEGAVSLAIDVRDTGIGISAKDLETIFDPFVQSGALRPDARAQKGTGLGLPIVRRLVAACGGTVDAESELGKGSVFHVRIGRVETVAAPAAAAPPRPADAAAPAVPDDFVPMLVDDIPLNLRILALHFRSLGIRDTIQAESGEQALELLRTRRPSAVFTDLWMPGMDGAALARAIRAEPAFAGVPVVAVTADNDASASFDASVFDDILVKPLATEKVADCLARLFASA